jgi:hypothetical protein
VNQDLWVPHHCVSNSWAFFVSNESSTKVDVQAMQVMRCGMRHSIDNLTSSHNSTKSQKNILSYNLEHGIISMKKHVAMNVVGNC